ncbi:MAG: hypothetical protein Q4A92_08665 [Corynebacterium sp.]|nr:hypothetical protein [Corynebacterium sp.]
MAVVVAAAAEGIVAARRGWLDLVVGEHAVGYQAKVAHLTNHWG